MSHFAVLVIGDDVDSQLERYSENMEVASYMTDCHCIGWKAVLEARSIVDRDWKSIDIIRAEYHSLPNIKQTDARWKRLISEYEKREKKVAKKHKLYKKPDPQCSDCNGKGKHLSTYNPESHWDWYEIGGRWNGYFELKNGSKADQAKVGQIKKEIKPTFAVVKDGEWYEKEEMGWWGITRNEKAEAKWNKEFKKLLKGLPKDTLVTLVDAHI